MPTREAFPIEDQDLDKWKSMAERQLARIDGARDLEDVLRELSPEETWRTLPEELALVFLVRHATCLFYWIVDHLMERTGQRAEVAEITRRGGIISPAIEAKTAFTSAYGLFVAASYIVVECERILRGKNQAELAKLDVTGMAVGIGRSFNDDLRLALGRYVSALEARDGEGHALIRAVGDELAITRDYWRSVADQATAKARTTDAALRACLDDVTFRHQKFTVSGWTVEKYREAAVMTWAPIEPHQIVGNADVVRDLRRQMDRLALYDPVVGRNPFSDFGAIVESLLLDGPPGTGKTLLQRMAMTLLARRADQVGLPYYFKSLTAADVKSEWYGKTAKMLAEILDEVRNPSRAALLCLDDVDLLFAGTRDAPGTGGGDRDIMKGLMDFFAGTGAAFTGGSCAIAATNAPRGTDDALRQRFVARYEIRGPETAEQFADLVALELAPTTRHGLALIASDGYEPCARATEPVRTAAASRASHAFGWRAIGQLCAEFRKTHPQFTGRSVKNALDVVRAHAADFEVPEEWYADPAIFRSQPWDRRVEMIRALYQPITGEAVMDALQAQCASEVRYVAQGSGR